MAIFGFDSNNFWLLHHLTWMYDLMFAHSHIESRRWVFSFALISPQNIFEHSINRRQDIGKTYRERKKATKCREKQKKMSWEKKNIARIKCARNVMCDYKLCHERRDLNRHSFQCATPLFSIIWYYPPILLCVLFLKESSILHCWVSFHRLIYCWMALTAT